VINRQRPNIYLAWTSGDLKESREEIAIILQKAGFNVFPQLTALPMMKHLKKKSQ
jgi:hypothetical protein